MDGQDGDDHAFNMKDNVPDWFVPVIPNQNNVATDWFKLVEEDEAKKQRFDWFLSDKASPSKKPKQTSIEFNHANAEVVMNSISEASEEELAKLQEIVLVSCGLKELPQKLLLCKAVWRFLFRHDELVDEDFYNICENLHCIQWLYLCRNSISTLPRNFLSLTKLTRLRLKGNPICIIGKEIGKLSELFELWINKCKIHTISSEIVKLEKLDCIWVKGNDLPRNLLENTMDREETVAWFLKMKNYFEPRELMRTRALLLVHARNKSVENDLSVFPKEIVSLIATYVWGSRSNIVCF